MRKLSWILLFSLLTGVAQAASTRTLENVTSVFAPGGSTLTVPTAGTTLTTDTNTQTLTNKSLSGASNTFTSIPASAVSSGQVAVSNGGTGASTLTTGAAVLGNGTSAVTLLSPGTSGNVMTSNGSTWTSAASSAFTPTINNSQASPQAVTAGGGVVLSAPSYVNFTFITGSGGAVTVTATPSVTACSAAGQVLYIVGESASNQVTLQDEAALSGAKLRLNGNWVSTLNQILTLVCDGNGFWIEQARTG